MPACAAAGAAFLIAVLWLDLMFDVQAHGHRGPTLPVEILSSIAAYYRRVTTDARPMGSLISVVMLLTLLAIMAEIILGRTSWQIGWTSLVLALSAIGLALFRTVRNAVRLGDGEGAPEGRTTIARKILGDHLFCLAAMSGVLCLQLIASAVTRVPTSPQLGAWRPRRG